MLARAGDRLHAGWLPMTVDRETPLQPRVLLDRMVVVVGGGRGVQAYAVIDKCVGVSRWQ